MWQPRHQRLKLNKTNNKQDEKAKPEPLRRRKRSRRNVHPFIDSKACVEYDASGDEKTNDENNDLDGFIVAHDNEF